MRLRHIAVSALAALLIGLALMPAAPVAAHADYDSSTPARGEQLAVAPTQVEITFTQDIQKIAGTYDIAVNKDRGSFVTAGLAVVNDGDRTKLSVPLIPTLEDGRYVVNWKNLSDADGDPKQGAFSFYLNHVPTAVDLANDAALEQIGNDSETPAAVTSTAATQVGETPVSSPAVATPPLEATPDGTPVAGNGDDDGDANTAIVIAIVVIIGVAVGGGFFYFRNRSAA